MAKNLKEQLEGRTSPVPLWVVAIAAYFLLACQEKEWISYPVAWCAKQGDRAAIAACYAQCVPMQEGIYYRDCEGDCRQLHCEIPRYYIRRVHTGCSSTVHSLPCDSGTEREQWDCRQIGWVPETKR